MVPYDDPHYRRKNLSILSLIFIIYIAAGGSIDDKNGHTLPFLNITLERPWVVVAVAFAILLWFAIRYWQTEPGSGLKDAGFGGAEIVFRAQDRCKNYNGGQITNGHSIGIQADTARIVPNTENIRTLLFGPLVKEIQAARPILYDPKKDQFLGGPAQAWQAAEERYSRPSFFRAIVLSWQIRRDALKKFDAYYDWLLPWALFILAALLTLIEVAFAGLNGMLY